MKNSKAENKYAGESYVSEPEAPESAIDDGMTDIERANLAVTIAASKAEHQ